MKVKTLVSLLVLAGIATSMQSADAQEGRRAGARFNFAPNVWKNEAAILPKGYATPDPAHNVRPGAVPSNNMLGLDPAMLTKPAPPPVMQPHAMPTVASQVSVPRTNTNFNPMFGKPMVAQLPAPIPMQASPLPMAAKPLAATPASAPAGKRHVATGVSGRLMRPARRPAVRPESATPAVASYGKNFGYVPGAYLPSSTGGINARAELSGKLLRNKK